MGIVKQLNKTIVLKKDENEIDNLQNEYDNRLTELEGLQDQSESPHYYQLYDELQDLSKTIQYLIKA
jgi:hypothetical protein